MCRRREMIVSDVFLSQFVEEMKDFERILSFVACELIDELTFARRSAQRRLASLSSLAVRTHTADWRKTMGKREKNARCDCNGLLQKFIFCLFICRLLSKSHQRENTRLVHTEREKEKEKRKRRQPQERNRTSMAYWISAVMTSSHSQ